MIHRGVELALILYSLTIAALLHGMPVMGDEASAAQTHIENRSRYMAVRAAVAPKIDGVANEEVWAQAPWRSLNHRWLGPEYSDTDFDGRFKVVWTNKKLFILAELVDDVLLDQHRDPLEQYWDDDCLEIFLDEDYSGGEHQHNHNAFAYHMSLDNQAIDIGTDGRARNYSHHVESRWQQKANTIVWELAIDIYSDSYSDSYSDTTADNIESRSGNVPIVLSAGKEMGLMVAYCDNDGAPLRENFIGSESVPVGPKDRGYKDAGLFGLLILVDSVDVNAR